MASLVGKPRQPGPGRPSTSQSNLTRMLFKLFIFTRVLKYLSSFFPIQRHGLWQLSAPGRQHCNDPQCSEV
jgi:hypothetical protein